MGKSCTRPFLVLLWNREPLTNTRLAAGSRLLCCLQLWLLPSVCVELVAMGPRAGTELYAQCQGYCCRQRLTRGKGEESGVLRSAAGLKGDLELSSMRSGWQVAGSVTKRPGCTREREDRAAIQGCLYFRLLLLI